MTINRVNVERVAALVPKYNAPVIRHLDAPMVLKIAFEAMQPVTRQTHGLGGRRRIRASQDIFNPAKMIRPNLASVTAFIKSLQTAMFE